MTSSQRPDALDSVLDTAKPLLSLFGLGRGGNETYNPLDGGLGHFQDVLAAGGSVDKDDAEADRKAHREGNSALSDLADKLNLGEVSTGTADDILDSGRNGLRFFADFGPAYVAWTGSPLDLDGLTERYTNEAGLDFGAFGADAKAFGVAQQNVSGSLAEIDPRLAAAKSNWTGAAADKFSAAAGSYRSGASDIDTALTNGARGISDSVSALEKIVLAKAKTVSGLFADTLPTSGGVVDGKQARTLVAVAKGTATDEQCQWALLVLGIQVTIHYSFGDEVRSFFGSDDIKRRLRKAVSDAATQGASQWCTAVLAPEVQTRLRLFDSCCSLTKSSIVGVFDKLAESLRALHNPFPQAPPASTPPATTSPAASTPDAAGSAGGVGAGGMGAGGAGTGGGGAGGAGAGGGGLSGTAGGSPAPGFTLPQQPGVVKVPDGSGSGTLSSGADSLDGASQSSTGVAVNPDHSVTLGGGVTVGPKQADGSFTVTDGTGKHQYQVSFDSSGDPHVVQLDAASAGTAAGAGAAAGLGSASGAGIDISAASAGDGSLVLGGPHGVEIGGNSASGFTVTDTASGTPHSYQVSFGADGQPHAVSLPSGPLDSAVSPQFTAPAPSAVSADHSAVGGVSAGSHAAGFHPSGAQFEGAQAAGDQSEGLPGAGNQSAGATTQLAAGNQFGSGMQTQAAPSTSPVAGSNAAAGAGHGEGGSGGMPMMGGMGAGGRGGSGEDSQRRYPAPPSALLDEDELDRWDRLGPVIG